MNNGEDGGAGDAAPGSGPASILQSLESAIAAVLGIVALLLFLGGMVLRLVAPGAVGGWIEEVTIYLVVWALLLAAAGCVQRREHVRADFFIRHLPASGRKAAEVLAALAGLVFCAALAWFGWLVVDFALMLDERGPSVLQLPKAYYYAALPVSMAAMALRYVVETVRILRAPAGG